MKDEKIDVERLDDETMVGEAYERLVQTYLKSPHRRKTDLIDRAFNFAKQAHKGVRRLSGEPYIMHPIAVAQIACGEIGLGSTSICAALLHDVVEDTDYTVEDISNLFGPKIAQIVDGVTKISGGIFGEQASSQAESFKKLLITMSDDIRVILVKISDRLHNMRTLGSQRKSKQFKIAGETLYLYAPTRAPAWPQQDKRGVGGPEFRLRASRHSAGNHRQTRRDAGRARPRLQRVHIPHPRRARQHGREI